MKISGFLLLFFLTTTTLSAQNPRVEVIVLGHIQDAGSPHIGCERSCCALLSPDEKARRLVSSIGIIDHDRRIGWIIDATPDFPEQLALMKEAGADSLGGIFLTHAHIGHYTGLMYLGREALGSSNVPVFVMPKMMNFLKENGPWSQLVALKNISLFPLSNNTPLELSDGLSITPMKVPHRDEYSETVGFRVESTNNSLVFIPDINKWQQWEVNLADLIQEIDYALIDGSFYSAKEIGYRPIEEIPHPTVGETMEVLSELPEEARSGVYFIHMNHTNPILDQDSPEYKSLAPFRRVDFLQRFPL